MKKKILVVLVVVALMLATQVDEVQARKLPARKEDKENKNGG